MARPAAVQSPISRMGRMRDTTSAAKPSTAATLEAVTGRNLLASAWSLVLVDGHVLRLVDEAGMQVHQRGQGGDHHGQRHHRRDHGEGEAEQLPGAHRQRDRGAQRQRGWPASERTER